MNEKDILSLIRNDSWMMTILRTTASLSLPDWWIGAGFVRSKVWDSLHGYTQRTPLPDIDVIYFDPHDFGEQEADKQTTPAETHYEQLLAHQFPHLHWSVTNQARMHVFRHGKPYKNSEDAVAHWVETATCVAIKLDDGGNVFLIAPHGITDLVHLVLRPTPGVYTDRHVFNQRIATKEWLHKWPKLRIAL